MPVSISWDWVFVSFLVGIGAFYISKKVGRIKDTIAFFSILFLFMNLLGRPKFALVIILSELITSAIGSLSYLIGANISRWLKLNRFSVSRFMILILLILVIANAFGYI